jgi:ketosteroid isomerase-like protein
MCHGFTCLIMMAALGQSPRGENPESKDSKELNRLENVWNDSHLKGDADALDRLWSSDLVVIIPGLPAMTKGKSLAVWKGGKVKFKRYQSSGVEIRVMGDTAIVTGRAQRTRTLGDRSVDDDWLFTKVYVREKESWQVISFHASEAPREKK